MLLPSALPKPNLCTPPLHFGPGHAFLATGSCNSFLPTWPLGLWFYTFLPTVSSPPSNRVRSVRVGHLSPCITLIKSKAIDVWSAWSLCWLPLLQLICHSSSGSPCSIHTSLLCYASNLSNTPPFQALCICGSLGLDRFSRYLHRCSLF